MNVATKSVEFSFNNHMHKQTVGVAMGSPLGPALAHIFVGYYENKLFTFVEKPLLYTRYVDDTLAIFRSEAKADKFFTALNLLYSDLKFTIEKEANQTLPFLDVKIEKKRQIFNFPLQKTHICRSAYSLGFIWTIKTQNQPNRNSSTPSTGYLFQKQTSTTTGFYMIYLAAKWLPRSDNQLDYFRENCPFLSTCQKRFTKMLCLSQITLDWQHFAQVRNASQIECFALEFGINKMLWNYTKS